MIKVFSLILLAEILTTAGQICLKKSADMLWNGRLRGLNGHFNFLKNILSKPLLWAGIFAMSLGLVAWLVALDQAKLSIVFALGSMQYLLLLFFAHIFLDEKIDSMKLTGTLLVVIGIILTLAS